MSENYEHFKNTLNAAIPFWVAQIKSMTQERFNTRFIELTSKLPSILGAKGDILMYGSEKEGEVSKLFNEVAEAVALMSFFPGGIKIFGGHWENQR